MRKAVPIGVSDYRELKTEGYYSIDKSFLISEFLSRKTKVTLVTRPRRFGKTINMSMLAEFFDITKDSKELFRDTEIMETEWVSEMNQYPTIFLSLANAKGNKLEIVQSIKKSLFYLYKKNQVVLRELDSYDQILKNNIEQELANFNDGNLSTVGDALSFLMERLEAYYGKKVMVFIDEYDTPFIEAHVGGFYEEVRGGLASMLHCALKTSTSLQYAMLTGIQRVAKESIFSGLNNLIVYTVKDNHYSKYFGFTEEEVKAALEYYGLSLNEDVKAMYDGYRFGDYDIYNPWSVLNYISRKRLDYYWVNTSGNKMIRKAMEGRDSAFDRGYEELIQTGKLETVVYMETSFFEMNMTENLWGLLVNAGYLTISETISQRDQVYVLRIPNQEVQNEFQNLTAYYLEVSETELVQLFSALKRLKKEDFEEKYQNILLSLPSYYDLKDENSYHMMVLGMCAWLSGEYEVISNREEGKGRCDIILKAKKEEKASYVLEFKYIKSESEVSKEQLQETAKQAVEQIKTKAYDADLSGKIIYIGLAHWGKEAAVEW